MLNNTLIVRVVSFCGLSAFLVLGLACGSSQKSCAGAETCACYDNNTCNNGLSCLSKICVSTSPGGAGAGGGVAGGAGAGGTPGLGGVTSVGGGGATALGGGATANTTGNIPCVGAERCTCYPNQTCNGDLACLSGFCVSLGGAGGTGMGGAGIGGTSGLCGVTSAGGGGTTAASGGTTTVSTACPGAERCDCYPNQTCNANLVCLSNLCVAGTGGTGGTAGPNLIKNGDFSAGKEYWDLTYQAGEVASSTYDDGQYCVYNLSEELYLSFSLGYPPTPSDAFVIDPGATYTLSYRANGLADVTVKIGHSEAPYTELYSVDDAVPATYQTFTHQVSVAAGDTAAGLVFNGTLYYSSSVCFDDVQFFKN